MGIELEIDKKARKILVRDASSVGGLRSGCFGKMHRGIIELEPEEALYLIDVRNAKCVDCTGCVCCFSEIAQVFEKRMSLAKYFAYSAYRNRGLVIKRIEGKFGKHENMPLVKYPEGKFVKYSFEYLGHFFEKDLICLVEDAFAGREIYENGWFGQYGVYKADKRGRICKLDAYETLFLQKYGGLEIENGNFASVMRTAKKRRADFDKLYFVYEDWRLNGFVLKTGFKFGTHFRVYFPGAGPAKEDKWAHSEHVLQFFARKNKMLISEWARAIRVAHSVRKTFVLAIEGQKKNSRKAHRKLDLDFALYGRKGEKIAKPDFDLPKHLMMALSEEEYLCGEQLAGAIEQCKEVGLGLILAIVDRETATTFYEVKRIDIAGSKFEYYELEWVQP